MSRANNTFMVTALDDKAGISEIDPETDPVLEAARARFGIEYLYPWQRLVIANILDAVAAEECARAALSKRDAHDTHDVEYNQPDEDGASRGRQIVLLPTGAGKSLCFQIPALFFSKPTLVIFPLLALMADQERRLRTVGLEPAVFRGGQTPEERMRLFARLEGTDGREPARIVIANPEVLAPGEVLDRISRRGVAHLAIDEAHCVAEWGDTFRPAYLELARVIERVKPLAVTGFTATASPEVLARTAEALFAGEAHVVRGESDRPNIAYAVTLCHAKDAALVREVARRKRPLVVFCATRGGTERAALLLRETLGEGEIRFYHAGLSREEKTAVETWFHGHESAILTATCAWGLDIYSINAWYLLSHEQRCQRGKDHYSANHGWQSICLTKRNSQL
jgi:ATP-dependent DNA helicase RecQ